MGKNAALEAMLAQRAGKPKPDALNAMLAKRAGAAQPAAVTTPTNATAPCYLTPLDRSRRRSFELRRRRETLTPEDAERLLRNRDKVLGAALSMHVIHDVPLDVVGERLAASGGVPPLGDLRRTSSHRAGWLSKSVVKSNAARGQANGIGS